MFLKNKSDKREKKIEKRKKEEKKYYTHLN